MNHPNHVEDWVNSTFFPLTCVPYGVKYGAERVPAPCSVTIFYPPFAGHGLPSPGEIVVCFRGVVRD